MEIIDYGEVELGFAFAKAVVVHNDGDAALTVSVEVTTPGGDPDLAHWDELNELADYAGRDTARYPWIAA